MYDLMACYMIPAGGRANGAKWAPDAVSGYSPCHTNEWAFRN